jgi:hypothetical protein
LLRTDPCLGNESARPPAAHRFTAGESTHRPMPRIPRDDLFKRSMFDCSRVFPVFGKRMVCKAGLRLNCILFDGFRADSSIQSLKNVKHLMALRIGIFRLGHLAVAE